jgi:hypothetical protein
MTINPAAIEGLNQMSSLITSNWVPILWLLLALAVAYFWIQYVIFKDYAR